MLLTLGERPLRDGAPPRPAGGAARPRARARSRSSTAATRAPPGASPPSSSRQARASCAPRADADDVRDPVHRHDLALRARPRPAPRRSRPRRDARRRSLTASRRAHRGRLPRARARRRAPPSRPPSPRSRPWRSASRPSRCAAWPRGRRPRRCPPALRALLLALTAWAVGDARRLRRAPPRGVADAPRRARRWARSGPLRGARPASPARARRRASRSPSSLVPLAACARLRPSRGALAARGAALALAAPGARC